MCRAGAGSEHESLRPREHVRRRACGVVQSAILVATCGLEGRTVAQMRDGTNTVTRMLGEVHQALIGLDEGSPADYIPELARVPPDQFGITLATADGFRHSVGEADVGFTIQSVSKAFVYGLVLDEVGIETVDERVDVEPSGDAFNEISLDPITSKPMNPMINAGAIAITSMVPGDSVEERFAWIHRNRAIAYLLRNGGILGERVDDDLDLYFRPVCGRGDVSGPGGDGRHAGQRWGEPDHRRASAHRGRCRTGAQRHVLIGHVRLVRQLDHDDRPAGKERGRGWRRCGVAGPAGGRGLLASPRRTRQQRSGDRCIPRTVAPVQPPSLQHTLFNTPTLADQVVRRTYRIDEHGSLRQWPIADLDAIRAAAGRVCVIELQGDLFFAAVERVIRAAESELDIDVVVFDCSRLSTVDVQSEHLFTEAAGDMAEHGLEVHIVDPRRRFQVGDQSGGVRHGTDIADVIETIEVSLLESVGRATDGRCVTLAECELFDGLDDEQIAPVKARMQRRDFEPGEYVCRRDERSDAMYVLTSGNVDIIGGGPSPNELVRIASLAAGSIVGDIAAIEGGMRTADVVATTPTVAWSLSTDALAEIERCTPELYCVVLRNILLLNFKRLRGKDRALAGPSA